MLFRLDSILRPVHRGQDPLVKQFDTDFPEPGGNPEHSGEPEEQVGDVASECSLIF
jgi:hypothetical protein